MMTGLDTCMGQVDLGGVDLDCPRPQPSSQPRPHWPPRLQAQPPLTHQQM